MIKSIEELIQNTSLIDDGTFSTEGITKFLSITSEELDEINNRRGNNISSEKKSCYAKYEVKKIHAARLDMIVQPDCVAAIKDKIFSIEELSELDGFQLLRITKSRSIAAIREGSYILQELALMDMRSLSVALTTQGIEAVKYKLLTPTQVNKLGPLVSRNIFKIKELTEMQPYQLLYLEKQREYLGVWPFDTRYYKSYPAELNSLITDCVFTEEELVNPPW